MTDTPTPAARRDSDEEDSQPDSDLEYPATYTGLLWTIKDAQAEANYVKAMLMDARPLEALNATVDLIERLENAVEQAEEVGDRGDG